MKKFISIGLTAVMIISALVVLDVGLVTKVKAATNPPYDAWDGILGNGIWGTDGDWILGIGDVYTYTYPIPHTIIVNGNLTIEQGGSLTLQGITLKMATPTNGTYWIRVKNATNPIFRPQLTIENQGANPSIITSNIADGKHRFGFVIEAGSGTNPVEGLFTMRNSELHECGWGLTDSIDYKDGGLWIGSGNANIQNNLITDCYDGIVIHNAFDPTIAQNNIQDCEYAGIYIRETFATSLWPVEIGPGNTINNNRVWGVGMYTGWYINVHNNTINSNGANYMGGGVGVALFSRNITIQHNIIEANEQYSLWVADSFDISVYRNSLNGSLVTNSTYFYLVAGLDIRHNSICTGGNASLYAYLAGWGVSDASLDNNYISNNGGIGAIFDICQIDVTNNIIQNNLGGGIGLRGCSGSMIDNNKIINNDNMGLFLVASNFDVRNNVFEGNGDGTPYANDPVFQDCGMSIINSNDIRVYNNQFIQNVRTTGSDEVDGIYLLESNNIDMWNNIMDQNDYNLHCRGGSTARDTNSTYIKSPSLGSFDVYLEDAYIEDGDPNSYGPNHVTFLNTTFDDNSVNFSDNLSTLEVQWYLHILVINSTGPVASANVTVSDNANGTWSQNYVTNFQGRVKWIVVTEYIRNLVDWVHYTPHNITASKGSEIGYAKPFMDISKYVIVDISPGPPQPQPPLPPTNLNIALLGTDSELTWNPSPDDGGGANDVKGYVIYRATSVNGPYANVSFVPSGLPTYSWLDTGRGDLDWNNYFYIVKAKDMDDLEDDNEDKVGKFVSYLEQDWNLISVPLVQSNTKREHVLQSIENNYAAVQGYHAGKSRPWLHWHRGKPNYFNDAIEITHKDGYYIDMIIADHLVTVGKVSPQVDITLKSGWNLVGYPCLTDRLRDDALSSISGKYNMVLRYDTTKDREVKLTSSDYMQSGDGHWIHATQDCTWIITN